MITRRSPRATAVAWQEKVDEGLETGEAPVFDGGVNLAPLDGAGALLAMTELAASRRDLSQPLLATGGVTPWWLVLLMRPNTVREPGPAADPPVAFTAPDPAVHQAALTALDRRQAVDRDRPADLPIALQSPFTPDARPASAAGLESLPFALSGEEPAPRDGWVAWVAVVVVIILLLLALIV